MLHLNFICIGGHPVWPYCLPGDIADDDDVITHICWMMSAVIWWVGTGEPQKNRIQFSSVAHLCPTLCDPMDCSTLGFPVHHHLPEFAQTHVHRVGDAIQLSHPLSSPSPPALNLSQGRIIQPQMLTNSTEGYEIHRWSRRSMHQRQVQRNTSVVATLQGKWETENHNCHHLEHSRRHYFADKGPSSQSYGFSSSHVWMWELDHKESWAPKNGCFWTVVLGKTLQSALEGKQIQPVHPKGNQSRIFIERTYAEAETSPEHFLNKRLVLKWHAEALNHTALF